MKRVEIDGKNHDINIGVEYMSFSAHADAKGIMEVNLIYFFNIFELLANSSDSVPSRNVCSW